MKALRRLLLACLLFSGAPVALMAALPPDVEQLIQNDKFAEALARVEMLLKEKPADQELLEARKELQELVPAPAPPPSLPATAAPAPPPSPQVVLPAVDAKQLEMIMADLGKATGEARQPLLKELTAKTSELTQAHPDSASLWAMRGIAVYELNQAEAAREAGANLLRLGADRSGDDKVISLLAMLKRKGWLATPEKLEEERRATAEKNAAIAEAKAAEKRRQEQAARKAEAYRRSPEGVAERLRKQLGR